MPGEAIGGTDTVGVRDVFLNVGTYSGRMNRQGIGRGIGVGLVVVCLIVSTGVVAGVTPTISASGGTVTPGETITVEITAEEVGMLSLSGIPMDWGIESIDSAGATALEGTENGSQKVGWAWTTNQNSVSVSVTLAVPSDASAGDQSLTVEAGNSDDEITTSSVTVTVEADGGIIDNSGTTTDTATATESADDPTATATTVGTDEPTETKTAVESPETTTGERTATAATPTATGGPGFGPVVAVVALIAIVALASRRA